MEIVYKYKTKHNLINLFSNIIAKTLVGVINYKIIER